MNISSKWMYLILLLVAMLGIALILIMGVSTGIISTSFNDTPISAMTLPEWTFLLIGTVFYGVFFSSLACLLISVAPQQKGFWISLDLVLGVATTLRVLFFLLIGRGTSETAGWTMIAITYFAVWLLLRRVPARKESQLHG